MHSTEASIQVRAQSCDPTVFDKDMHPVLRQVLSKRDIQSPAELDYAFDYLLPWQALKDIDAAVDLLQVALRDQQRIMIVGDFDADGATSCAVATRALEAMGAGHVEYLVPNRFEYGYGLSARIVSEAAENKPDLIVTVDNGISSVNGVARANELGIKVLVTDHHLPGKILPAAAAIVNPNQQGDEFPSKNLAGVGVIFYLMLALRARLRDCNWFEENGLVEPNMAIFLDLVALGTVADVVPLDRNNRLLVQQGVNRIRAGRSCPGIQSILQIAGCDANVLSSSDLGFLIGPRLNAAGRLTDMRLGIDCLLSESLEQALPQAQKLDALNRERRAIETQMKQQAMFDLQSLALDSPELPFGLCLYDRDWHQGVVGILASRIKDRVHRPVIAFANGTDGEIKGSARSVKGFHIRDALEAIATKNPDLISRFGGHAMAAGLSLDKENLQTFQDAFDAEVRKYLDAEHLCGKIDTDGELPAQFFRIETAEMLRNAGPWGQGFPEPVFEGRFDVVNAREVGSGHLKLSVKPLGANEPIDAIFFHAPEQLFEQSFKLAHLAYRLDINTYRGLRSLQLMVEYLIPE